MPLVLPIDQLRTSPTAVRFQGGPEAGLDVSFFYTTTPPGKGPGLHVHPYAEVFLVQQWTATFTVGDERLEVEAGNVVVVPPETPHGFKNFGEGTLNIFSIHPSPEVIQTWLEDD